MVLPSSKRRKTEPPSEWLLAGPGAELLFRTNAIALRQMGSDGFMGMIPDKEQ